ncbi:structural cement protein Gp24 [Saccharibacter floricola]|uniref:Uncharacterized protein n=1 Tax=Saccharibacter floricola DSM 15669 TaxID=1123227 RepID=A0ABQ0NZE3_9PROT|nr:hypothetical protein [Saccharibacter floricola]GBQ07299.1 hypothetical protein AA15669_1322 [Saccharibacter floricola DSM 15669]
MSFPTRINYGPPLGYPGDQASANPTRTAIPGELGHRAGDGGVTVGAFAWVQDDGVTVLNKPPASTPNAPPTGFAIRDQSNVNLGNVLSQSTMIVPPNFMVTLHTGGDYFAVSSTPATPGQAVYASLTDGTIQTGSPGAAPSGTSATGWIVTRGADAGAVMIMSATVGPAQASSPSSSGKTS